MFIFDVYVLFWLWILDCDVTLAELPALYCQCRCFRGEQPTHVLRMNEFVIIVVVLILFVVVDQHYKRAAARLAPRAR
jgi:hypothetical protein